MFRWLLFKATIEVVTSTIRSKQALTLMSKHISKYFGEIDLEKLEEGYDSEIEYKGKTVTLTLFTLESKEIESSHLKAVDDFLDNLSSYEAAIRAVLRKDLKAKGFTHSYIEILIDYSLDEEDIEALLAEADKKLKQKEQLLSVVFLKEIRFYPEADDETLAIFDYTISEELTDNLLVVGVSKDKQVRYITVES
jgi:hypothetical protein